MVLREMMFGTRERFAYRVCDGCGSAWIDVVPMDLERHYPPAYYSFAADPPGSWPKRLLHTQRAAFVLGSRTFLGALAWRIWGTPEYLQWCRKLGIRQSDRILDVGCGRGQLLVRMSDAGFSSLTGIDPYLEDEAAPARFVRLHRRDLAATDEEFDFVMMHHSLEHIADPVDALRHVRRLLRPGGWALVRLPVAGRFAGRQYGADWVQWDAPRHLFIPTPQGMERLAAAAAFTVEEVQYDSLGFQFWGSEMYRHDVPLCERERHLACGPDSLFDRERLRRFEADAVELNRSGDGDQACFFLRAA